MTKKLAWEMIEHAKGVSVGEAGAIVPVDYSRLLFAALFGWFLFSEIPTASTLAGAAVIIVATLVLSWHEVRAYRLAGSALTAVD